MTRIKHDNISDWLLWPQGKSLHLGNPENQEAQRHKIYVNSLGDALVFVVLDDGKRYPLAQGPGLWEIEFAVGGECEIQRDGDNEVFLYSFGTERTWYDSSDNPSWTRPHQAGARDAEMELVAAMTARNMLTLFAKQNEALEKRHASEISAAVKLQREGAKTSKPKGDPKQSEAPSGDDTKPADKGADASKKSADDGGGAGD